MKAIFYCIFIIFLGSCTEGDLSWGEYPETGTDPGGKPAIDFENMPNGTKIPIYYTENGGKSFIKDYKGVKIGEYLWMDSNFTDPVEWGHDASQHQINKCLDIYRIDTTQYSITPQELNKYFGQYYSRWKVEHMHGIGNMLEGGDVLNNGKWGLPSAAAFRQLFGMCGDASERAVRTTLCYKVGEIPIMKEVRNAYWIESGNTNKYGFNLLFAGGRCHVNEFPWGTCYGPHDCYSFLGNQGDLYTFYGAVMYPADGSVTAKIHDFPDTRDGKVWAWLPVRWCRKLTAEELGYELYVNRDRSDIRRLDYGIAPPAGYEVLPNGYLRGFYVQFILDNPQPVYTVAQLREMEKNLVEVKLGTPLT